MVGVTLHVHREAAEARVRDLHGTEPGKLQWKWRMDPPPYAPTPEWGRECVSAILDALTREGVAAWDGDAVGCVSQIVEAYAKRVPAGSVFMLARIPIEVGETETKGVNLSRQPRIRGNRLFTDYGGAVLNMYAENFELLPELIGDDHVNVIKWGRYCVVADDRVSTRYLCEHLGGREVSDLPHDVVRLFRRYLGSCA